MPAERAGYTVTMFLVDVSPSMGKLRTVEVPDGPDGETKEVTMTNLEWSLQYVLLKVQEMIFHGRKTDQCGVILFGTEGTENVINTSRKEGYEHVSEYIGITQPNSGTLAKIQEIEPSTVIGDPVDAIIVGIQTQDAYLEKKKSWTRKMVLVTDGENPIEIEDWEITTKKINDLDVHMTVIGIDFDDEDLGFQEEDKSDVKRENERFFHEFVSSLKEGYGLIGTAALALQECAKPDVKETKSVLMGTTLRVGDVQIRPEEAVELPVKMSKCTSIVRPPSMKKFAKRISSGDDEVGDEAEEKDTFVQLGMETEYLLKRNEAKGEEEDGEDKKDEDEDMAEKVDKEQLIRGFKYGASYVPCPDGQFDRLNTKKGIDICGFFPDKHVRRDLGIGEVQYLWADPSSGSVQVAFSSLVQGMLAASVVAIARWVSRDGMDPKMGLLIPRQLAKVDCFLWLQMPFADDVRRYAFPPLEHLVSKKGEPITKHPFIPTNDQIEAMDAFVDSMDLMRAGDKDEEGNRMPWFDPRLSYNPAVHRIKQALFHAAIVTDLKDNPLPPPHPEVTKYFEPPAKVLKRARDSIENCKATFKVKQVPKRIARKRKDGHNVAMDEDDDEPLLLDQPKKSASSPKLPTQSTLRNTLDSNITQKTLVQDDTKMKIDKEPGADSETEPESDADVDMKDEPASTFESQDSLGYSQELSQGGVASDDRPAGRLIGLSNPLPDFNACVRGGDSDTVVKAVDDFAFAIKTVIHKPFSSKRNGEMVDCLKVLRSTCLKNANIDQWNSFLSDLKHSCVGVKPGNPTFWDDLKANSDLTLIGKSEASASGAKSNISDESASEFLG